MTAHEQGIFLIEQGGSDSPSHGGGPKSIPFPAAWNGRARANLLQRDTGARVNQAECLARVSEILIELFRSPVPTYFFQTPR